MSKGRSGAPSVRPSMVPPGCDRTWRKETTRCLGDHPQSEPFGDPVALDPVRRVNIYAGDHGPAGIRDVIRQILASHLRPDRLTALEADPGFKRVDPDDLIAEAEYDMGILMREDPTELMHGDPYDRARWLAARTALDATAIWEWGAVERVSTGLWCTKLDMQSFARETLAAAERVAE